MAGFGSLPDPETHARPRAFTPPADRWATVQVIGHEGPFTVDKAGNTKGDVYHRFEIEIMDEPDKGRKFKVMTTTQSTDEERQASGLNELNLLCVNCGFKHYREVDDTRKTFFKPFRAKIVSKQQKNDERYFNTNIYTYGLDKDGAKVSEDAPAGKAAPSSPTRSSTAADKPAAAASSAGANWRDRAKAKENAGASE